MKQSPFQKFTRVCLALLFVWLLGLGAFVYHFSSYGSIDVEDDKLDAIIVLTGGQKRIEHGLNFLKQDKADLLYISGVNKKVSVEELLSLQSPTFSSLACCIEIGVEANDTVGNALEVRNWLKAKQYKTVYLVTSHYHMPRAILEVSLANPALLIYPQVVVSDEFQFHRPDILRLIFFEYNKYLFTVVKSWLM